MQSRNKKRFKNIFRSIIFKFILILIAFVLVVNISITLLFRFSTVVEQRNLIPVYIRKMNEYVLNDIGIPPDTAKARQISRELSLNIRYISDSLNWASSANVPHISELKQLPEFNEKYKFGERFHVMYDKRIVHVYDYADGTFIIYPAPPRDFFSVERAIPALIVLIIIIFLPFIYILKKLFNPLNKLSYAVREIGKGNYDVELNIKRNDELGDLSSAIKEMASDIKNSIKSKEQLLMDVSHELRTPLTRIKLGLEVKAPKDKINEDVVEIEQLINNLLDSYRHDRSLVDIKPVRKNLVYVIKDVINEYDDNTRLWFSLPDKKIDIPIDELKFKIVLRNIIDNALKYSNDKVEISIDDMKEIVTVKVKDHGQGIPEKDMDFIFEPFYRGDRSRSKKIKGFGLGLSICKKIMEAHNGKIEIISEQNSGTEVRLILNK